VNDYPVAVDEMTVLKECQELEGGGPRSRQEIDHKALESDHGFLIYVSQTWLNLNLWVINCLAFIV
jgi:hypothetical protein